MIFKIKKKLIMDKGWKDFKGLNDDLKLIRLV